MNKLKVKLRLFVIVRVLLLTLNSQAIIIMSSSSSSSSVDWQILTAHNFSSEIRRHPHVLLFVSLPWSGESRSLMKETAHLVAEQGEEFSSLRLMYMHSNVDKKLADALGASGEMTVLYYHHSVSYKYNGRLRPHSILSSVRYCMSLSPEDLPLKNLGSLEELRLFLDTTDKALLLLEFCGWTDKLMAKGMKNVTEDGFKSQVHFGFGPEAKHPLMPIAENNQKGMENMNFKCGIKNRFTGIPWMSEFSTANVTTSNEEIDSNDANMCTPAEFQSFDSFFSKFITLAKELFLPPERFKFGLVTEKSLVSYIEIGDSSPWLVLLHHNGCPVCSRILKDVDDLTSVIQMDNSVVTEVVGDGETLEPAFPANQPSVLLLIDRSSDSSESRRNSEEALDKFRELALQCQSSHDMSLHSDRSFRKSSVQSYHSSNTFGHPKLKLSPTAPKEKLKDKMSLAFLSKGQQFSVGNIASDLHLSSLNQILEYVLKQENKAKLSLLAKQAGFQLLSDDLDIKVLEPVPSDAEVHPSQVSAQLSKEESLFTSDNLDKDGLPYIGSISLDDNRKNPGLSDRSSPDHMEESGTDEQANNISSAVEKKKVDTSSISSLEHGAESGPYPICSLNHEGSDTTSILYEVHKEGCEGNSELADDITHQRNEIVAEDPSNQPLYAENDQYNVENKLTSLDVVQEEDNLLQIEKSRQLPFKGSFFFSDGNLRLLEALTGGSKIPSLVILDPISQQHYVFSEGLNFSYSSMALFLERFLEGSLPPYQRNEGLGQKVRDSVHPPFVNLNFHEVDSVPRITAHTFSKLVFGLNGTRFVNASQSSKDDILVAFSASSCGFCQRMELVVREVYRSIKEFANTLKGRSRSGAVMFTNDETKEAALKIPRIYLMDCTLNDCSLILKSIDQMEVYPALTLFPAQKNAVSYEGDISVTEIVKFLATYGTNSHHLITDNGILFYTSRVGVTQKLSNISTLAVHKSSYAEDKSYEVNLKNSPQKKLNHDLIKSWGSNALVESRLHLLPGLFLVATDKLIHSHPFDKSVILVVKAVKNDGFIGLIINKQVKWDIMNDPEDLEMLKEAPISLGGPVIEHGLPLVALSRRTVKDQHPEVLPGIYFLDQVATINEIQLLKAGKLSISDYWFFLGYSSWGRGQLYDEIAEGAWELSDTDRRLDWPQS